jgi:hypothetical protein
MKSPQDTKPRRTAIVVLGMHRSGTSALAGMLDILGCDSPATPMKPTQDNPRGYFESSSIYSLHTKLLTSAGSRWDDWTSINPGWMSGPRRDEFQERAVELLATEFKDSRLFVLKDPRICRLVPFWEDVLKESGAKPLYVLTHRNPLDVAASMFKRDGMPTDLGMLIWLRHVLDAEKDTRGRRRTFTSYDRLMRNWAGVADRIQSDLQFNLPRYSPQVTPQVEDFLSSDIRHHAESDEKVLNNPLISAWLRDTYAVLQRWVAEGEDAAGRTTLDTVRAELESAAPAFATVAEHARGAGQARQELDRLKADYESLQASSDEHEDTRQALEQQVAHLNSALAQRSHEAEQVGSELKAVAEERDALARKIEELEKARDEDRAALALAQKKHAEDLDVSAQMLKRKTQETEELEGRIKTQFREIADITRILADSEKQMAALRESQAAAQADEKRRTQELETARQAEARRAQEAESARQSEARRAQEAETARQAEARRAQEAETARKAEARRVREAEKHLADLRRRAEELEAAAAAEKERAERAEFGITALQSSTSWKLMAPVRAIASGFGRRKG